MDHAALCESSTQRRSLADRQGDDVYSKARDSPIWIQTDPGSDDYSVIVDRHEEDFDGGQRTGVDARKWVSPALMLVTY